ncbi:MAG: type II toxin-antitoxin system RelE/ParE family toxin [Burkholderiales bacterium]|nr:type II toxin-antitoxin system RelE/ParE family toxin [Burkholderiales bacterium]
MPKNSQIAARVFKTAGFAKAAKKALISDDDLSQVIRQVIKGQVDDLGGGIYKKRLNDNMHRSIVLAKGERSWIFEYLFAKKDRENIDHAELVAFRKLAKAYAGLTEKQLDFLMKDKDLIEIDHDDKT